MGLRADESSVADPAVIQTALLLGLSNLAEPGVLAVSVMGNDVVGHLWQVPAEESQCHPLGLRNRVMPTVVKNSYSFCKTAPSLLQGAGRDND